MNLLNTDLDLDYINKIFRITNKLKNTNNDNSTFSKDLYYAIVFRTKYKNIIIFHSAMLRMGGDVITFNKSS